jgi:hypothetical protein
MKKLFNILSIFIISILILTSCEFDNYDAPTVIFHGKLMNGNKNLQTSHAAIFRLYQYKEDGYVSAGSGWIEVWVNEQGEFNTKLFPGRYKMVINTEGGINYIHKWEDFPVQTSTDGTEAYDTLKFTISSNGKMTLTGKTLVGNDTKEFDAANFNLKVKPFYQIEELTTTFQNDSIVSNFSIRKLTDRTDNQVLFRNVTMFVCPSVFVNKDVQLSSAASPVPKITIGNDVVQVQIRCLLKDYYSNTYYINNYRNYAFIRIGLSLRLSGQEYIYSEVMKVEDIPQETILKFK